MAAVTQAQSVAEFYRVGPETAKLLCPNSSFWKGHRDRSPKWEGQEANNTAKVLLSEKKIETAWTTKTSRILESKFYKAKAQNTESKLHRCWTTRQRELVRPAKKHNSFRSTEEMCPACLRHWLYGLCSCSELRTKERIAMWKPIYISIHIFSMDCALAGMSRNRKSGPTATA